ncbi:hypothetical protein J2R62_16560 [Plesiomonas shigelloides]|uniref:Uncharacterized protein n=1 Tax=Plesiomonas shigelloides TaxID=703 RepID=A0A8I1WBQ2_PLESH|nr:hypothetical protein [Plesiomonas shigelloides]MBO1109790.1 hypothetical protein [Plesiomonas shigelloides]
MNENKLTYLQKLNRQDIKRTINFIYYSFVNNVVVKNKINQRPIRYETLSDDGLRNKLNTNSELKRVIKFSGDGGGITLTFLYCSLLYLDDCEFIRRYNINPLLLFAPPTSSVMVKSIYYLESDEQFSTILSLTNYGSLSDEIDDAELKAANSANSLSGEEWERIELSFRLRKLAAAIQVMHSMLDIPGYSVKPNLTHSYSVSALLIVIFEYLDLKRDDYYVNKGFSYESVLKQVKNYDSESIFFSIGDEIFDKAQLIIDFIIAGAISNKDALSARRELIKNSITRFSGGEIVDEINSHADKIRELVEYGELFIQYMDQVIFHKAASRIWYVKMKSYALANDMLFQFFSIAVLVLIKPGELKGVIKRAKLAMTNKTSANRKKRNQLNVSISSDILDSFRLICKNNNIKQSEFVEDAIKLYISTKCNR